MRFGIGFANTLPFAGAAGARRLAQAAEAAGFESLWTVEHVIHPVGYASTYPYSADGKMPMGPDTPLPDPLVWLSYLAGVTSSIRLATGILILPERNPVVLAKEVATLEDLSGGRVELGIGVGWLREEFDALGVPWERRGDRTDDYVGALRALWTQAEASHRGEFSSFAGVSCAPRPAQGSVPIVVGGHSEAAARRAGRLGDGFWPAKGNRARLAELWALARATAVGHGRDPDAIELTLSAPPDLATDPVGAVGRYAALGASRLIVPAFFFRDEPEAALERFGTEVIARVND